MFKTETDLVENFCFSSIKLLLTSMEISSNDFFCVKEFDSNNGIADIVTGSLHGDSIRKVSIPNPLAIPISKIDLGETFSLANFGERFGYSNSTSRKCMKFYENTNFIKKLNTNQYMKINEYRPSISNIIAIEAKLKNWKKALGQAYRYRRFSNYSFVLIDETFVNRPLKSLNTFINYNIGLISASKNSFKIIHIPKRINVKSTSTLTLLNEFVIKEYSSKSVDNSIPNC